LTGYFFIATFATTAASFSFFAALAVITAFATTALLANLIRVATVTAFAFTTLLTAVTSLTAITTLGTASLWLWDITTWTAFAVRSSPTSST